MTGPVVAVEALEKSYGSVRAVDAISFEVAEGEIFGVVGRTEPGRRRRSNASRVCVHPTRAGACPRTRPTPRRRRAQRANRAQLQQSALPQECGSERPCACSHRSTSGRSSRSRFSRARAGRQEEGCLRRPLRGQKQRLSIALALVGDPQLVFFDELTSGLDPQARHATWDLVRDVRAKGKTVFLTTHYMEEAERLCDRVMIIDAGRIVALNTPAALVRALGAEQRITFGADGMADDVIRALRAIPGWSASSGRPSASWFTAVRSAPGADPGRSPGSASLIPRPADGAAEPRGRLPGSDRARDAGLRARRQ